MKMRRLKIVTLLFLFATAICAQDYFTVIKVSGNIVIERTGSPLDIGTSFAQDENLLFKVPDSRAAVINPQMGRFLLTAENADVFKKSKSNYLPSTTKISMRAAAVNYGIYDLNDYFKDYYVIIDEIKIPIDQDIYPLTDKDYFCIIYDHNNKSINKKLAFNNETLIIIKNELLTVDGKIIPDSKINKMRLIYIKDGNEYSPEEVCTFIPVFPDNDLLYREIKIIVDQLEMNPYEDKLNEAKELIKEFYGKVDENSLKKWLYDNFRLKP